MSEIGNIVIEININIINTFYTLKAYHGQNFIFHDLSSWEDFIYYVWNVFKNALTF